jgi:hypothetical protein
MKRLLIALVCFLNIANAQKNVLDLSYNISYRNSGLKWSGKLTQLKDWKMSGFTGGAYWNLLEGNTKLALVYDTYKGFNSFDPVQYRFGFSYSSLGPNSSCNISLFQANGFGSS